MASLEDRIADQINATYHALPAKFKPVRAPDGLSNWVPLSGIVFVRDQDIVKIAAVATGMKCIPSEQIASLDGLAIHDSHAEVLAIRLFNQFLLAECKRLASIGSTSDASTSIVLRWRTQDELAASTGLFQPFAIRDELKICMYCSEAPCGDASMELTMATQADATPWEAPALARSSQADASSSSAQPRELKGRGYFSELGIVRRKPARADSRPSLSKSCTDKLSLRQCTSLLSTQTSVFVAPSNAYLDTLIVPSSQFIEASYERAFGLTGRMRSVVGCRWPGGYEFRPFLVTRASAEFRFSRRSGVAEGAAEASQASNVCALCNPSGTEVLIAGRLQGRKVGDPKGASFISRRKSSAVMMKILHALDTPTFNDFARRVGTYADLKTDPLFSDRIAVKREVTSGPLDGWIKNNEDNFSM